MWYACYPTEVGTSASAPPSEPPHRGVKLAEKKVEMEDGAAEPSKFSHFRIYVHDSH